jgi:hypothetical protein
VVAVSSGFFSIYTLGSSQHTLHTPSYYIHGRIKYLHSLPNGLINYIDTKSKCRYLKKVTCKGTLRQVFICLRPPPLLGCCLGLSCNFAGSDSGQIECVKLLRNMVSNRTQQPPPTPSHTLSVYTVLRHREESGGGELHQREG